jgi:Flp pilus assembly protein TadG
MKTGNTLKKARGFLSRLRRDESGNTLAMVAAGVIPVIGIVGGAVDMSRGYMAKARLQQACDAGALAARSAMDTGTLTNAQKAVGYQYFDFNYPSGSYSTTGLVRTYTQPSSNTGVLQPFVTGTASVEVPTTLMRVFGNEEIDLEVTCTSKKDVSNADVAMVLDVTGSMNSSMRKSAVGSTTETRISALRRSVQAFYNGLGGGSATGDTTKGRIRYGIVPYGIVVNTGYLLRNNQMVDSHNYSSRAPITGTLYSWVEGSKSKGAYGTYSPTTVPSSVVTASQNAGNYGSYNTSTTGTGNNSYSYTRLDGTTNSLARTVSLVPKLPSGTEAATSSNCYKLNTYSAGSSNTTPGIADVRLTNTTSETSTNVTPPAPIHPQATRVYKNFTSTRKNVTRALRYSWFKVGNTFACRLEMATTGTTPTGWDQTATTTETSPLTWTTHASGTGFVYTQRTIDVSGLKAGGSTWNSTVTAPNINVSGGTWTNVKLSGTTTDTAINVGGTGSAATLQWNGCVEERTADPSINASTGLSPIPAGANDLDVTRAATGYDTMWRPWLPTAFFNTTGGGTITNDECPSPALKLQEIASYTNTVLQTSSHNYPMLFDPVSGGATSFYYPYSSTASQNTATLKNYIDRIKLVDGTVHDSGFIWGMHLLSGQGMFASENPDFFNGNLVSRNLVFMTDGDLNPAEDRYSYTGFNQVDGRVAPKSYDQNAMMPVHNRRLRILCQNAKEQGITVWVVVIKDGVSQDADLRACATSSAHFKTADTADELVASFTQIAQSIGGLRLTQ